MKLNLSVLAFLLVVSSAFSYEIRVQDEKNRSVGYGNWVVKIDGEYLLQQQFLRSGHVVLDVGANIGEWSEHALMAEPAIQLYSFEPLTIECNKLRRNLAPYSNYRIWNLALSDEKGRSNYYYYNDIPEHAGLSGFFYREVLRNDENFSDPEVIQVPCDTLEFFCKEQGLEKIDFLKIDTEGAEWKVIQGAKKLIEDHLITAIQFEYGGCYEDANTTLEQVFNFFQSNNYLVFRIFEEGLISVNEWDSKLENYEISNWVAITREAFSIYFPS
ncbi:MAG: FkbM family methyltransferase [Chlamydiota bacterium]